jgi:hypothetical protein
MTTACNVALNTWAFDEAVCVDVVPRGTKVPTDKCFQLMSEEDALALMKCC